MTRRLTPTYMIVLMTYATLWHYFGEGPFMREYVADADGCETAWWTNLLYINNIYGDSGWVRAGGDYTHETQRWIKMV